MKKLPFALFGVLCFFAVHLSAQNTPTEAYRPAKAKTYQTLNGEINTICFFVHTSKGAWNDREMEAYLDMLDAGQKWLQEQAAKYDQELSFRKDRFLRNFEPVYLRSLRAGDSQWVMNKLMKQLNFQDFEAFLEWYKFDLQKEKLKIILFVKDNSRSHAYNYFSHDAVDIAVVYDRNFGVLSDKYVIIHELLHLFGAWDLYHGNSQSIEKAEQAKEFFPNSIMINTFRDQENLEIDELTAWRIGWHDNFKEGYMNFSPVWKDRTRDHINDVRWQFSLVRERDSQGYIIKKPPKGPNSLARKAFLIGIESVYAIGWTAGKERKIQYITPFGFFFDYKLRDRLYIGTGINFHKIGYHTVQDLNGVTIKPTLFPWLPGTSYTGIIRTRRNETIRFWEYPLRATYVLKEKRNLEIVVSQSIGLNQYDDHKRKSFYWYQSSDEYEHQDWRSANNFTGSFLGFTSGLGIRKSLLRRWHLSLGIQANYLGFKGVDFDNNDIRSFRTASLGLQIGLKYNFRNELYEYSDLR